MADKSKVKKSGCYLYENIHRTGRSFQQIAITEELGNAMAKSAGVEYPRFNKDFVQVQEDAHGQLFLYNHDCELLLVTVGT